MSIVTPTICVCVYVHTWNKVYCLAKSLVIVIVCNGRLMDCITVSVGALRNISSAGEETRRILRVCPQLVDSLMWIVRAATGQENTDEKVSHTHSV